jgi:hypothetical protein
LKIFAAARARKENQIGAQTMLDRLLTNSQIERSNRDEGKVANKHDRDKKLKIRTAESAEKTNPF